MYVIPFLIDSKIEYLVYQIVNFLQVPITWKIFLNDQRGPRKLNRVLSSRTLSLRASSNTELADHELKQTTGFKLEEIRQQDQLENICDNGYEETELNCSDSVESENEFDSDSDSYYITADPKSDIVGLKFYDILWCFDKFGLSEGLPHLI